MRSLLGPVINRAPVPYAASTGTGGILGLFTGGRGEDKTSQLQTMSAVGTVFSIVHRISTALGAIEWHMHRMLAPGTGDNCTKCDAQDVEEVTDHLALRIVNRPNDFYTRQELFEAGQQHQELAGETWLLVERDPRVRSLPLGLWTVRPDRMEVVPSPTEFIAGYVYHGPNGEKIPLERDEVIMMKLPDPLDPYRGLGPVSSIMRDIDSVKYGAEWNRNFFLNSAEPGGIIKTAKRLSTPEWNELRDRWRDGHKGVSNAHRVAILEGHEWVPRAFSPRDIQFAELRNVSRDAIMEAWGMSKFGLGIIDDVNRATADAAMAWFSQQFTMPRALRWQATLNARFLPMFGSTARGVELAPCDPTPADPETENAERESRVKAYTELLAAGVDPAEAAAYCGLPEFKVDKPEPITVTPPGTDPNDMGGRAAAVVRPFVPAPRRTSTRQISRT